MTLSRRKFVKHVSAATALSAVAARTSFALDPYQRKSVASQDSRNSADVSFADPDRIRKLAMRAIDTARSAGASFADVRITRTITQGGNFLLPVHPWGISDSESLAIGVRALVNGYWGFAASPYWEEDEATQLALDAVAQSKFYAQGSVRRVEIGTLPAVSGTWIMPTEIDPFIVPIEEKIEYITARIEDLSHYRSYVRAGPCHFECVRQERTVANTEGSYMTQVVYSTDGSIEIQVSSRQLRQQNVLPRIALPFPNITAIGGGWEVFKTVTWDNILQTIAKGEELTSTPVKPLDVGRYDVVLDPMLTAQLLDNTLGVATELDRALGYEANAAGTSFLGPDPLEMLGTFRTASTMVNVMGDRTDPGGLATVQWDDEGVAAQKFSLVKDGVVVDYQTSRESAEWIAPWYEKSGKVVSSRGCAASEAGDRITMQHRPNLALQPAKSDISLDDLVKQVKKGMLFSGGGVGVDFQARTGIGGGGSVREIVDGKLGAIISSAAFSFSTVELWKSVIGIGGQSSCVRFAGVGAKGEPQQETRHSITAPPVAVNGVAVVDPMRKV